jgi:hypothetical protein
MAQNKIFNYESLAITSAPNTAVNLFNIFTSQTPAWIGLTITQPYAIMKHVRLMNSLSTAAVNVSLYKGATLTSLTTQSWAFSSVSIPAQSYVDWYGQNRFDSQDFLVGVASLSSCVIIDIDGEIGIS